MRFNAFFLTVKRFYGLIKRLNLSNSKESISKVERTYFVHICYFLYQVDKNPQIYVDTELLQVYQKSILLLTNYIFKEN